MLKCIDIRKIFLGYKQKEKDSSKKGQQEQEENDKKKGKEEQKEGAKASEEIKKTHTIRYSGR